MSVDEEQDRLIHNLNKLHTTDLGADRIKRNLCLGTDNVVSWCREAIQMPGASVIRRGKNWYIYINGCEITVNAYSCTIITAHRKNPAD